MVEPLSARRNTGGKVEQDPDINWAGSRITGLLQYIKKQPGRADSGESTDL